MESELVGLTSSEVEERVRSGQVNRAPRSNLRDYCEIVRRNLVTLFNVLVAPAAVALFLLGEYRDALAVSGMAITNTVLGLIQEIRAKIHLERLTLLAETKCRVLRDGSVVDVPSTELVRDEVVLLETGEAILADGVVLRSEYLEVDEALLTGESDPAPRGEGDRLLSGSFCVAGRGAYRIEQIGAEGFAQRLSNEARTYRYSLSPTQSSINGLLKVLTTVTLVLIGVYFLMYWLESVSLGIFVKMAAATLTSMIPQGLVLMATLAFVLGAVRMSKRGALARELGAVETMARVDTLCMDKTGTLTTNRLELLLLLTLGEHGEDEVRSSLSKFVAASGETTNKTLLALRASVGETPCEVLDRLEFKSQNRYSAVRIRDKRDSVLVLGAPDALEPMLRGSKADWKKSWEELVERGLRLLLFAEADAESISKFSGTLEGIELEAVALLAFQDELRPEAGGVLHHLGEQGIGFKIISGDHPETVRSMLLPLAEASQSKELERIAESRIATGKELEEADSTEEVILDRAVFGRVSPWQKLEIVRVLQSRGRHVAMIGDGVNDVLPIKNAELGIAMGSGSRATKTVAGLVLQNDDFSLLPETLEEGRTILRNLRRASKLFLVKNVYMLVLIIGSILVFRIPFPFLPTQVTLLNFLTIGIPALLITWSRDREARAVRSTFLRDVGGFALRTGLVLGLCGMTLYAIACAQWDSGSPVPRTMLLTTMVLMGLVTLVRVLRANQRNAGIDRVLYWMAAGAVPLFVCAVYTEPVAGFFELVPLTPAQWGLSVGASLLGSFVLLAWDAWSGTGPRSEPPAQTPG